MQIWIISIILAQFIWAFTSLIDKFVISKGYIKNPLVYIVLNGAMSLFLIFLLPFVRFQPINSITFLLALFSSAAVFIGIALYYKAVQYEEISKINILFQFIPVIVFMLSFLFLGESLTKYHFIGFLFLIAAGILVSHKKVNQTFKVSKAFYYILAASFFIAGAYVSAKYVFNVTSFWNAVLWLRLTGFVALLVLLIPSVRKEFHNTFKIMKNKIKGLLLFKIIIDFSAFILSDFAILLGPVSLVSALSSSTAPLFVFIIALLSTIYFPKFIREDIHKRTIVTKVAAIILIIMGILFVNS